MRALFLAGAAACGLCVGSARASIVVNFTQVGNNVVATGSGSLNLTGLTFAGTGFAGTGIIPSTSVLGVGPSASNADYYTGVMDPGGFGTGGITVSTTTSGDFFGIDAATNYLVVPDGYVSGSSLSGTDTFANATFASLGLTPGQYVYTASNDTFVINIVATPEPASLSLLVMGVAGIATVRRRRTS